MTRQKILDLYFLDARHKLIDLAAFLDRVERANGTDDFRIKSFRAALGNLTSSKKQKAKNVLIAFSDLTTKPVEKAEGKGACGAFPFKNVFDRNLRQKWSQTMKLKPPITSRRQSTNEKVA